MKRVKVFIVVLLLLVFIPALTFSAGQKEGAKEKPKVTFFWALYDGLTEDFRANLQNAFMEASPDIAVDIVPVQWDQMHDKLVTSIAGGKPPEISVIGTRWILELMAMDAVDEVTSYVSKTTLDNISPGAMEAKIKGKLMGLPIAAGARIMTINLDLSSTVPNTMEELRDMAIKVKNSGKGYGLIMPGKKHTEQTDFAYYLYSAGGSYFETNADGSYGKCAVNSPAGVKALEFMVKLANEDKAVQEGYLSMNRMESHPVFYSGKAGYVFIGAWVESAMTQAGATFPVKYAMIPPFAGSKPAPVIITDSVAILKGAKNKKEAGKFLDFFYQD
ncbi:MAG: sugar ABC transporter substrate-binding protein, partial [Spirochaetota bacterium]